MILGKLRIVSSSSLLIIVLVLLSPFFQAIFFEKDDIITSETVNTSLLKTFDAGNFTYKIDRRLAFDQVEESPFYTVAFNYNRLIHNKFFYQVDVLLTQFISIFDFEKLISPFLNPLSSTKFLSLWFFQLPLILIGLAFLEFKKDILLLAIIVVGISGLFLFGEQLMYRLLMLIGFIYFESKGLLYIYKFVPQRFKKLAVSFTVLIFIIGQLTLIGLLTHQ